MPSKHHIFAKIPSLELTHSWLESLGVGSLFPCEFTLGQLREENFTTLYEEIRMYYLPHKRAHFFSLPMIRKDWIPIIRHVCHLHNYKFESYETTFQSQKLYKYRISVDYDIEDHLKDEHFTVSFN